MAHVMLGLNCMQERSFRISALCALIIRCHRQMAVCVYEAGRVVDHALAVQSLLQRHCSYFGFNLINSLTLFLQFIQERI